MHRRQGLVASLERALSALSSDERREIAREISGLGRSADGRDQALAAVHRPEWLPELAWIAARIVENGAGRTDLRGTQVREVEERARCRAGAGSGSGLAEGRDSAANAP